MELENLADGGVACADPSALLVTSIEGIRVILPERNLSTEYATSLDWAFNLAYRQPGPVIIDLRGCTSLSERCLLVITRWAELFTIERRSFGVCTTPHTQEAVLAEFGSQVQVTMFSSLSAAVQAFRPGARKPLGDILLTEFGLAGSELFQALRQQKERGGLLGQILLVRKAVSPMDLALALSQQDSIH